MMSLENNSNASHMPMPSMLPRTSPATHVEDSYSGISYGDEYVSEEMECPHSKVGVVIGSRGIIIQEIMQRTHCKIVVMQDGLPDGQPRNVVITGDPHQIQLAKQLINSVIADGPSAIQSPGVEFDPSEPVETEEMICPPEKVGLVIGSKGVIVQDIMRRTGCKITVNQNFPEGEPRIVVITGHPENIDYAKSLVALVIANGPAALNQSGFGANPPGHVTEEMDCPHERVGIVIGAKGTIVQDIMRRTGSRIVVQQDYPDGHPRKVVISGTPQQVRHARHLVSAVIVHGPAAVQGGLMMNPVMSYVGNVMQDLKIVQSQVGKLIGPGGSTIKDLQLRFAVKMNIDQLSSDPDERRLRITGEPARVQAASQMVWHILHNSVPMGMMHPSMAGQMPSGYGMPMMGENYDSGAMHNGYYPPVSQQPGAYPPPPHGNPEHGLHPSHAPIGQGLGADGSSGRLMPPSPLSNGFLHQVVYVLKSLMPRLLGPNNSIMYLVLVKSGANVDIESAAILATAGQEMTKINIVGTPSAITLAGQMIQEVLINGPDKLSSLPDAPQGFGYENPNFPPQQPPMTGGGQRHGRDPYGYNPAAAGRSAPGGSSPSYPPQLTNYSPASHAPNMLHHEQGNPSNQYPPAYPPLREPYTREQVPQSQSYGAANQQQPHQQQPQYSGANFGSMLHPAQQYQQSPSAAPTGAGADISPRNPLNQHQN